MNNVAIIPARGGSKRIPRKNIRLFAGKPMIAHSIKAAIDCKLFGKIIVSTDDNEIADIAMQHGAEVPFIRPKELADDHATTDEVIIHALNEHINLDEKPDYACCIYATAPFIRTEYLIKGFHTLQESNATTAFTVTSFPYPIFRALQLDKNSRLKMFWPQHRLTRSQDLQEAYHDAGQFYWLNTDKYFNQPRIFSDDSVPILLPRILVQDIDTPEDWKTAEILFEALQQKTPLLKVS